MGYLKGTSKTSAWVPSSQGSLLDGILFSKTSDGSIKIEISADKRATMHLTNQQKKRLIKLIEESME